MGCFLIFRKLVTHEMKKRRRLVYMIKLNLEKWDAFVVSTISIIYGLQLFVSPHLLHDYRVYSVMNKMLDSRTFGVFFITLGFLKMFFIFRHKVKLRALSIALLGGIWMFFFVGFVLSPVANSLWVLPLAMFLLCLGISLKELGNG